MMQAGDELVKKFVRVQVLDSIFSCPEQLL